MPSYTTGHTWPAESRMVSVLQNTGMAVGDREALTLDCCRLPAPAREMSSSTVVTVDPAFSLSCSSSRRLKQVAMAWVTNRQRSAVELLTERRKVSRREVSPEEPCSQVPLTGLQGFGFRPARGVL